MLITRGKLTPAQAAQSATVVDCVPCGGSVVVLTARPRPAVDHRCGTAVAGPVWTVIEPPVDTAADRARAFDDAIAS
jgi:hypothetical protein